MSDYLEYDGQILKWMPSGKTFNATSGMRYQDEKGIIHDWQKPADQCLPDAGPIPEGRYYLALKLDPKKYAADDGVPWPNGSPRCNLRAAGPIQRIPRGGDPMRGPIGSEAGYCEEAWVNWGEHRVRLEPADTKTAGACKPGRGGFYLHDSTKGYTHGCIEVEGSFFDALIKFAKTRKQTRMLLIVSYKTTSTHGGTKVPVAAPSPSPSP